MAFMAGKIDTKPEQLYHLAASHEVGEDIAATKAQKVSL